jgi:hypothetical protein
VICRAFIASNGATSWCRRIIRDRIAVLAEIADIPGTEQAFPRRA